MPAAEYFSPLTARQGPVTVLQMSLTGWFVLAAIACGLALTLMRSTGCLMHILDTPNARSMHARPIARVGGLPLLLFGWGLATLTGVSSPALSIAISGPLVLLVIVGALDDRNGLPPRYRLAAQLAAATVPAWLWAPGFARLLPAPSSASAVLLVGVGLILLLSITWAINLYNFMDGSDAIAGLMSLIGFGALALARPDGPLAASAICLSGAAAGFLLHNWPPARIFLGDAGSTGLGFLAAALGFGGVLTGEWPLWFPGLVFMPFWLDASLTLARRRLNGHPLAQPHREHAYQRLALSGAGHLGAALIYCFLMLANAMAALWLLHNAESRFPASEIAVIIMLNLLSYAFALSRARAAVD